MPDCAWAPLRRADAFCFLQNATHEGASMSLRVTCGLIVVVTLSCAGNARGDDAATKPSNDRQPIGEKFDVTPFPKPFELDVKPHGVGAGRLRMEVKRPGDARRAP